MGSKHNSLQTKNEYNFLAAAVYGASEGLDVLVLETSSPGGQAGSSSRIENYLGFPTGISGQDLAGRAYLQAHKFGAEMLIANAKPYVIEVENGAHITPLSSCVQRHFWRHRQIF
jgi:thioredoxin reductase (NADPH)